MKHKTYSQCCHDVAVKHGLGTTLVTGHKAQYFTEAHNLFISQFTDQQLQDMAMEKFPVKVIEHRGIHPNIDSNYDNRELCLRALRDLVKVMGGEK